MGQARAGPHLKEQADGLTHSRRSFRQYASITVGDAFVMRWRHSLFFIFALFTWTSASAQDQDGAAEFVRRVEDCLRQYAVVTPSERKDCLKSYAVIQIYGDYRRAAYERLFADFEDDFPVLDEKAGNFRLLVSAKHWKDLPRPGPESREFMLQVMTPGGGMPLSPGIVARLLRTRGESVDFQIAHFLEGKFDFDRDLEPLYKLKTPDFYAELKKGTPSAETFMAVFACDDFRAEATTCPALSVIVIRLSEIVVPIPDQLGYHEKQSGPRVRNIVLHPHIVVLHAPSYPISLTITDGSMDTDVYRWVANSMQLLESCWRAR
jgi:hypothetical protein